MVKDYLNESKIRCVYHDRGCEEIVQLQHLDQHEDSCGYTPAVCTNPGCGATLSKRDLTIHESELCEYRMLKCHSCGEMTKTLADMEKKIARIETNQANVETKLVNSEKNIEKRLDNSEKNMNTRLDNLEMNFEIHMRNTDTTMKNNTAIMEMRMANMETKMTQMKTDIEGKFETVNNEVKGLKTALVEAFDQIKGVLVKMDGKMEEKARNVRNAPIASGDRENIIVAGGVRNDSAEMFNWRQRTWSPLQNMAKARWAATSFVYNNQVVIAGGFCGGPYFDDMIRMNVDAYPDLSIHWSEYPVKLPSKMAFHSSVLYNDRLMVTGGQDGNALFDKIREVQVVPPYTVKTLSRMPEPRRDHCTKIYDDSLLILGGTKTDDCKDNLSSVVLYDIKNNVCKQLAPLPYEVSLMASVKWGDNVVLIGGADNLGNARNTVIMYNVKTEQSHMLPPMRYKRSGFSAVVVGNNIVVLGGNGEQGELKSVESFNFERNTWQELPEMSQKRWLHTAVVV